MHSIIIEESLKNPEILKKYKILNTKIDEDWHLDIIEVENIEKFIKDIQNELVEGEQYYFHLYDDGKNLIVAFRDTHYEIDPKDKNTWKYVVRHGKKLGIKEEQLDFFPQKFSDEADWLSGKY